MNQTIRKRIEDINNGILPEGYKQTSFGIFPCDWEKLELLDVCSCITKGTTPKVFTENGVRFVKVESIKDVYVENEWCSFIDQGTHQGFLARSILKKDDILFTIAGATIGKCAIIQECNLPANTNQALSIIRLRDKQLKWYVLSQLRGISMRRYVKDCIAVGAQPNISLEQMGKFSFYCSNKNKENIKIAEILMKWDEMVELQEQYIQKLELKSLAILKRVVKNLCGIKKKIKDCVTYHPSSLLIKHLKEVKNGFPVYGANEVALYIDKYNFDCDTVAIIKYGSGAGRVCYLTGKHSVLGTMAEMLPKEGVNIKFIYYVLKVFDFKKYIEISTTPNVYFEDYSEEKIVVPNLETQNRIVESLNAFDDYISLQKEKLAKIKEQRKAMQQYLLTGIVRVS